MMNRVVLNPGDSIREALEKNPKGKLDLVLKGGVYREKVFLYRPDVTIYSDEGAEIVFDDRHGTIRDGHSFSTGDSATFTVGAPRFKAIGITFTNSFDWPKWKKHNEAFPDKRIDVQAVALRTVYGSDSAIFEECVFKGYQDTIYADKGVHRFIHCDIYGSVDFIFGAGEAYFDSCRIISNDEGFVAAPSTFKGEKGFFFDSCSFISEGAPSDSVYLARSWHPSGSINRSSMAVFKDCEFGSHIHRDKWTYMSSRRPDGTERKWLPEDSRFEVI